MKKLNYKFILKMYGKIKNKKIYNIQSRNIILNIYFNIRISKYKKYEK